MPKEQVPIPQKRLLPSALLTRKSGKKVSIARIEGSTINLKYRTKVPDLSDPHPDTPPIANTETLIGHADEVRDINTIVVSRRPCTSAGRRCAGASLSTQTPVTP